MSAEKDIIFYALPQADYFTQGDRGRVSHALGIIKGFIGNGKRVLLVSGGGFESFDNRFTQEELSNICYHEISNNYLLTWHIRFLICVYSLLKKETIRIFLIRFKTSKLLSLIIVGLFCRYFNTISIVEINSFSFSYNHSSLIKRVISKIISDFEIFTVGTFNYRYVISKALKDVLGGCRMGYNSIVIPNGSSVRKPRMDLTLDSDGPCRLVYLGSLKFYYDLDNIAGVIIESFPALNVPFHIYGDGPEMMRLREIAKGHECIVLHGRYRNENIEDFIMPPNDILIVPYKEGTIAEIGSPTKLFEYMALMSPIIASEVGQSKYIINNGETGIIYKSASDIPEILEGLSKDRRLREDLAIRAYNDLLLNHTWSKRMKLLLEQVEND